MSTYFGNNDSGSTSNTLAGSYSWYFAAGYACPGTGNQTLLSLDINVAKIASGNFRMAVYTDAGNFVAQWDAEYAPGSTGWYSITSFVNQGGSPITPTLVGGNMYILIITTDGTHEVYHDTAGANTCGLITTDYTGGFPATITPAGSSTREYCVRALVEPAAAGGLSIPVAMHYYME